MCSSDLDPVFYSEDIDHWVVTRYDDVRQVMRDVERFSANNVQTAITRWPDDARALFDAQHFNLRPNLSDNDPPSHTNVRAFLHDAFGPRRISWLEPQVRRLANAAIDRFAPGLLDGTVTEEPITLVAGS